MLERGGARERLESRAQAFSPPGPPALSPVPSRRDLLLEREPEPESSVVAPLSAPPVPSQQPPAGPTLEGGSRLGRSSSLSGGIVGGTVNRSFTTGTDSPAAVPAQGYNSRLAHTSFTVEKTNKNCQMGNIHKYIYGE